MKPEDTNLTSLFSQMVTQYAVPHYQRPQAWGPVEHWKPLWADIEAKANEWAETKEDSKGPRPHYLGAIVLAKRPKVGSKGLDRILVIDGQQRLSTSQYILKALLMHAKARGLDDSVNSIEQELYNPRLKTMDQPEQQVYKLWPTFRDRDAHLAVMGAESPTQLREIFPNQFTQRGTLAVNGNHPRPLECTLYFFGVMEDWLEEYPDEERTAVAIESLRRAITQSLQIIVLWLDDHDDPQMIFECLNGRGAPLRPTDLIKNYIFMSAEAESGGKLLGEDSDIFKLWSELDTDNWMAKLTRGRITQTRLEWLLFYSLSAETGQDLDTTGLYAAYRNWAPARGGLTAYKQVEVLVEHSQALEAFIKENSDHPIGSLGKVAQALEVTTITPLALSIARTCSVDVQEEMFGILSSYLVRRAACGLVTKAYNNTFMTALRELKRSGFTPKVLSEYLAGLSGISNAWPTNDEFASQIQQREIYSGGSAICRMLLAAAANSIGSTASSEVQWSPDWKQLHLEHLMPHSWFEHWPLMDGTTVTALDAEQAKTIPPGREPVAARAAEIRERLRLVNTLGNLTVLSSAVNQSIQNDPWSSKKAEIGEHTQLKLNYDLVKLEKWDELAIAAHANLLASHLCKTFVSPPAN